MLETRLQFARAEERVYQLTFGMNIISVALASGQWCSMVRYVPSMKTEIKAFYFLEVLKVKTFYFLEALIFCYIEQKELFLMEILACAFTVYTFTIVAAAELSS